jgi:folate-binding protein YgfZ
MNDQYRIIENRAGYADASGPPAAGSAEPALSRGRLRLDGADAASFLQGLVSNDVASLRPGQGAYATVLTPQGRMLADLEIYRRPDSLVCSAAAVLVPGLVARFDGLVFAEDVRVSDVSAELAELVVVGGGAAELLADIFRESSEALRALPELAHVDVDGGFVCGAAVSRLPSFKVFVAPARLAALREAFDGAGLPVLSGELLEALRIEQGRPRWGTELTDDTIPLEAGLLDRAISTTKGCYVGQEIVIRILHRGGGRVARRLVTLALTGVSGEPPPAGTVLASAERGDVGRLTSLSRSPSSDAWIALGYVGRDEAEVGRQLKVAGTDATATVTGLAR